MISKQIQKMQLVNGLRLSLKEQVRPPVDCGMPLAEIISIAEKMT